MNSNSLALVLNIGVLFAVNLACHAASKWRNVYWAFLPPAVIGILLTGSRAGAWELIVTLGATLLLVSTGKKARTLALVLALVGCTAWLVPKFVSVALLERVSEVKAADTLLVREEMWQAGLKSWAKSPITGVGAGSFVAAVTRENARALVAHNTFVQILVEDGIIGMGIMLLVWGLLTRMVWQMPRKEKLLWFGVMAVWLIGAASGSRDYQKITWLLYALIMVQSKVLRASHMVVKRKGTASTGWRYPVPAA